MDKCVCVVHIFYTRVHEWFDVARVISFTHACAVKLQVICTV